MAIKKLIEVALPLEAINKESYKEKTIRHGHPSTLHLWWARRPLAAARAVIWASLVDDPSSHPELFPTEEEQTAERKRLFEILVELVNWEKSNSEFVLSKAKDEITRYTNGTPPELLDPFSGGGAIPFEAQRLGLIAHAHDLNPVSVVINKAMIDIPNRFIDRPAINPESSCLNNQSKFQGTLGLAEDCNYYGKKLRELAFNKLSYMYPKAKVDSNDNEYTVIAWIWARTITCPNPACGCEMPLARQFSISKKKNHEAVIYPIVNGNTISYEIREGVDTLPGTVNRNGAKCIFCNSPVDFPYIRKQAKQGKMGRQLIGIVAEGPKGRLFLPPSEEQIKAAEVDKPKNCPHAPIPDQALGFRVQLYGMKDYSDLYTNRQLNMLTTLSDCLAQIKDDVKKDMISLGYVDDGVALNEGGSGVQAYSEAIAIYLSLLIDQISNQSSSLCSWHVNNIQMKSTFSRQSLPMVWDYAESNPFCSSSGSINNMLNMMVEAIRSLGFGVNGEVSQKNAMEAYSEKDVLVSTDPPYYDNIGYADLSDYFYMWLRNNIKDIYPDVVSTIMTPKDEELIATPFRNDDSMEKAKAFFEDGMRKAFENIYQAASDSYPVTVFYAFKQKENDKGVDNSAEASTGWETMLNAIISSGFSVVGTWPIKTEMTTGVKTNINVLASSVVLVCRKRPIEAETTTRRSFINELKRELRPALQKLQQSNIAPVDLAQSAIGPGMGIFSKYSQVLEADGSPMTVRSALQIINQELDVYFNEQDGELDRDSRFCVDLYTQCAFNGMKFGDADTLARAKNTSVANLESKGILFAQKGIVRLMDRSEIPTNINPLENVIWLLTQQLTHAMETGGIKACAEIISPMYGSNAEFAKDLAYRLYTIAERKGWAQEAYVYNSLVIAWPDIVSAAADIRANLTQMTIDDIVLGGSNND